MLAVTSMSPPIAHYPVVQKRPKLSLKTSELPINYSTSSRGLSTIATPTAAVTPTKFNTFNNTFDLVHRPSPTSVAPPPSITLSTSLRDRVSRSQSPRPKRTEAAYMVNLPYGIKPILKNTPFPRVRNNSISASPRSTTRRVFFLAPKQVNFRNTIEEEIVNKVYTARHSDLFQHETTVSEDVVCPDNDDDQEVGTSSSEQSEEGSSISISSTECRKGSLTVTSTSISITPFHRDDDEDNSIPPATPFSTRKCRKWEWTLAPLPTSTLQQPQSGSAPSAPDSSIDGTAVKPVSASTVPMTAPPHPQSQPRPSSLFVLPPQPLATPDPAIPKAMPAPPQIETQLPTPPASLSPSPTRRQRPTSLEGLPPPRKRKAECLETLAAGLDGSLSLSGDNNVDVCVNGRRTGKAVKVGVGKRGRAMTL